MYRLIACDLDETLLRDDKTISREDIDAIRQCHDAGVKFVPATGRGYMSVDVTLKELGLYDAENEYVISFNGGALTENKNHRLLHFDGIPFELARELYKRGLTNDVCIHVYTKDTVYVYNFTEGEQAFLNGRMEVTEIFEQNLDFLEGQEIVKCLYMNTDLDYLGQIKDELKDITGNIDISYSSNRYIEFNHKGVTKGAGLLALAKKLDIDPEETIAIGDNFNDLSMIQAAGLGVGVANTVKDMKPLCDIITEATCNENAVAEVIHKYVFNK